MSKKSEAPLPVKKTYCKPKLTRYGYVRSLVQAGSGQNPEGPVMVLEIRKP